MEQGGSVFWEDLADDLKDPEMLRHYIAESARIATFNSLVNGFRDALEKTGLSQNALADAIPANAAAVRRLMSRGHLNPTLSTLSAVATGLGYRLTLEPLPEKERDLVSGALMAGKASDPRALIAALESAKIAVMPTQVSKTVPARLGKAAASSAAAASATSVVAGLGKAPKSKAASAPAKASGKVKAVDGKERALAQNGSARTAPTAQKKAQHVHA